MYISRLYPTNSYLFSAVFGMVMGPMAIAVFVYENATVFHDYDKMTSVFIHLMPVITIYK